MQIEAILYGKQYGLIGLDQSYVRQSESIIPTYIL